MAGINKVILVGHIGKDPDIFTFEDGTKRISFSLATTESYRDKNTNEWRDQTEWHNIAGYRYLAEKNIAKGDMVYVEGKLKTRKYTDRDGNERYITEVLAEKINMLAHPRGAEGGNYTKPANTVTRATNTDTDNTANTQTTEDPQDDLPF